VIKEAISCCPRERRHAILNWMKEAAIALVLGMLLTGWATSGTEGGTQSAPVPGTKTSAPKTGSPAFATPKDLPSKGSPGAKLAVVLFTEFH